VVEVVEESLDVRFHDIVVLPKLELEGQLVYGVQRSHVRAIAITTAQKVLLVDGLQDARDGELQQLVLYRRNPQRAQLAFPFGDVLPSNEFGSVSLLLESLHQVVDVLIEVLFIVLGAHAVYAVGGILANVAPALAEKILVEQLVQIAEPMLRFGLGLVRYSLQEG
jgi:uncharacterized protein YjeT (DUF2065 family)